MKANTIHRGLAHLLVTGAILASRRSLTRWADTHGVTNYREFQKALTNGLQGDEICLPRAGLKMLEDLEGFLTFAASVDSVLRTLLGDAQTSGGLLLLLRPVLMQHSSNLQLLEDQPSQL